MPSDFGPDSGSILKALNQPPMAGWIGWRLRILVVATLCGVGFLFFVAQRLASLPWLGADWVVTSERRLQVRATDEPRLKPVAGQPLAQISAQGIAVDLRDASLLQHSPRWQPDGARLVQQRSLHEGLAAVTARPDCTMSFDGGTQVPCAPQARGYAQITPMSWALVACALALYMVAPIVLLARPSLFNLLYATACFCQAGNLVFSAIHATLDLGIPLSLLYLELPARAGFDLFTGAALIHAASLRPAHLPSAMPWVIAGWLAATAVFAAILAGALEVPWLWIQITGLAMGLVIVGLLTQDYRLHPRPLTQALRRLSIVTVASWLLLTVALLLTARHINVQANVAAFGSLLWTLALAGVLVLAPFLSRSQQILREFGLLAAVSALATLLDLLFVGAFSVNRFNSGALSLFIALGVYLGARQWLLSRLLGSSMTTTERMFEQLYRIARDVEAQPERTPTLLSELLRELFDPLEVQIIQGPVSRPRITSDGSVLVVPVPALAADELGHDGAIMLRFAQRGNRLFSAEDLRLTERIVEQLERAVAYDRAVERGRGEERLRLAQDLHDDIGARLLTLIYKAQSPEMEEYARHTLQDLKTLTRGLAAPSHRLSHASAEWKADLTHRLNAANIELGWSCEFDSDLILSVVQWSGLTRALRELVSNAIAHSMASRVEVVIRLERDQLHLSVSDDGSGSNPKAWSHGLGLGGVRKRVKQLSGQVEWLQIEPHGIRCQVNILDLSKHR